MPHLVCWLADDRHGARDARVGQKAHFRKHREEKREALKQTDEGRNMLAEERPPGADEPEEPLRNP